MAVKCETKHGKRDANLIREREKLKEAIKRDLVNDENVLAVFYGGSMARGNHDRFSDLDLRIVVKEEVYEKYRINKKVRAKLWGEVLFYEDFPWAKHTVAHYKSFVKVDAFYYKEEDLEPSHYFKEEAHIEYDPYHIVRSVWEQSQPLQYEVCHGEFEIWRSKFFAHMHEVYRRVQRAELYYALHSLDMMRWTIAAGWEMVNGRQPNAPGEWSKYEGDRSPFDTGKQKLLAGWDACHNQEQIYAVMKDIVPEFKRIHKCLCEKLGEDERSDWVDEIVGLV
ncbi:nucleotidyltransferase domain-containing protein [Mangrovibacillus sp. Mu-81]|jgi:predicted nucleotidyltransferase|uniref:nucleotidyltransferase domain-containing protein n=1 Tax=Mangrovibacillus sp. Mu-81 TaxID=3121478 RepID=UPI002FE48DB5